MSDANDEFVTTSGRPLRRRFRRFTAFLTVLGLAITATAIGVTKYPIPVVDEATVMYAIAGAAGLMTIGVWVFAFSVSRRALNPIDALRTQVEQMNGNDLSISVNTDRDDEIGDVNRAFTTVSETATTRVETVETTLQETAAFTEHVAETAGEFEAFAETAHTANEDISDVLTDEGDESVLPDQPPTVGSESEIQVGADKSITWLNELDETVAELNRTAELIQQAGVDTNYLAVNAGVAATEVDTDPEKLQETLDEIQDLSEAVTDAADNLETVHGDVRGVMQGIVEELLKQQVILTHALTHHGAELDSKATELNDSLTALQSDTVETAPLSENNR